MYRIRNTCVGCHNCAMECPMQAIAYEGNQYQIDPDKCVECGLCEKLCHTSSVYDDQGNNKPQAHKKRYISCDVLVCGGGCGLITAIKAAELGKKVILIEKAKKLGGNTDYAHGFFPVYTIMHREKRLEDVREEAVTELWERTGRFLDKELIRTAVYDCGEFFDWLYGFPGTDEAFSIHLLGESRAMGPVFGPAVVNFPKRLLENLLCKDPAIGPGWSGTWIKHKMLEAIPARKLNVKILTEHAARHLITRNGKVVGVLAEDPGGETEISAKAVVLATGGLGRSDEKLQEFFGFFDVDRTVHRFSVPSDTGDAIDMLLELGVKPDPERMYCSIFGPAHHPFSYCLYRILEHPSCMSVNLNGKRWQDERDNHFMGRFNIAENPKECAWGIFTQEGVDAVAKQYLSDPSLSDEHDVYAAYQEDLDTEAQLPKPPVVKADTIEELADKIGIDREALADTLKRYNSFCKTGIDEDFAKPKEFLKPLERGPFYGIYGQRFCEGAFGGINVNARCEVLRNDGKVIPGLYGVGDATSAMHKRGELAPISELSWATASAYRSAISAVEYIDNAGGDSNA